MSSEQLEQHRGMLLERDPIQKHLTLHGLAHHGHHTKSCVVLHSIAAQHQAFASMHRVLHKLPVHTSVCMSCCTKLQHCTVPWPAWLGPLREAMPSTPHQVAHCVALIAAEHQAFASMHRVLRSMAAQHRALANVAGGHCVKQGFVHTSVCMSCCTKLQHCTAPWPAWLGPWHEAMPCTPHQVAHCVSLMAAEHQAFASMHGVLHSMVAQHRALANVAGGHCVKPVFVHTSVCMSCCTKLQHCAVPWPAWLGPLREAMPCTPHQVAHCVALIAAEHQAFANMHGVLRSMVA